MSRVRACKLHQQGKCYRCEKVNHSKDRFCRHCGSILKKEDAVMFDKKKQEVASIRAEFDKKMNILLQDDLMRKLIEEKLKGISL